MIYDCFTFFNELDLLEIRLNILNDVIDKFVLVEATKTYQGQEKPLFFHENKARYQRFLNKIIHIVVDEYPDNQDKSPWVLEHHQRNMIMKGLEKCNQNDIILISDVDEIPHPEMIKKYKDARGIKIFRQKMFYYFLNCINMSNNSRYRWNGTIMTYFKNIKKPQNLREMSITLMNISHPKIIHRIYWHLWKLKNIDAKGNKVIFIENGGWHFSYLGGVDAIIQKLESFAHSEYNKPEYKNPEKIKTLIQSGQDIFGRGFQYQFIPIHSDFPEYIVQHKDKYAHLIYEPR